MGRKVVHGILGKQKTLINTEFERVPELTEEERRRLLVDQLKPYTYTPSKHRALKAAGPVGEVIPPSPTPTPSITPSITPTLTPTPTITSSSTPTPTPTPSATPPAQQLIIMAGSTTADGQKSYDGINWSGITYGTGASQQIAYSPSLQMFVSADGRRNGLQKYSYSPSGNTWTITGPTTGNRVSDLKWVGYAGIFISSPNESSVAYYSSDAINWNPITWPTAGSADQFQMAVSESDNQIVAIREDGDIYTTYSGGSFTLRDGSLITGRGIVHYNETLGIYTAFDTNVNTIGYSYDGISWSATSSPLSGTGASIWSSNSITSSPSGLHLAVSFTTADAMTSTDGINWTATTLPTSVLGVYSLAVKYVPDISSFVLMDRQGNVWTSPDASTWTSRTKHATLDVFTINYGYIK